jgi:hypothetical protein
LEVTNELRSQALVGAECLVDVSPSSLVLRVRAVEVLVIVASWRGIRDAATISKDRAVSEIDFDVTDTPRDI